MTIIPIIEKAASEVVTFPIDWSDFLDPSQTISSSSWTVPAGITKTTDSKVGKTTAAVLTGGTLGTIYRCTNSIVTSDADTFQQSLDIKIVEK